jgi:hypothetical protein
LPPTSATLNFLKYLQKNQFTDGLAKTTCGVDKIASATFIVDALFNELNPLIQLIIF